MLANLPVDLVRVILNEFVDIGQEDLAGLDTAHCNRSIRANFLAALPFIPMVSTAPYYRCRGIDRFKWIVQKNIPLTSLQVSLKHFKAFTSCCRRKPKSLATVTKLSFRYDSSDPIDSADVVHVLAALPNLKDVDCSEWAVMTDHHFLQFHGLRSPLEVLNVTKCEKITPAALAFVVAKVGRNLKELHLSKGAVDDQALTFMASCCSKLHTLSASCSVPSFCEAIQLLCVKNAKTLRSLSLKGVAVRTSMVEGITKGHHTHITVLGRDEPDSSQSRANETFLQIILKNSLLVQEVKFEYLNFLFAVSNGKRVCEVIKEDAENYGTPAANEAGRRDYVVEACVENHVAIRSYHSTNMMKPQLLYHLVGYFGDSLVDLSIQLDSDVDDGAVVFLLERSPNLTKFSLHSIYSCHITDKSISKISLYCRHLTKLSLSLRGYDITDRGMMAMLEARASAETIRCKSAI